MLKAEYQKLIQEKQWQEMEDHFDGLPVADVTQIAQLDINTEEWIKFTLDNFDLAQQKWESPKQHYSEYSNRWATVNNGLGRNEHNTFELNYGMNGDSNEKLKTLLGAENIEKLKADPESVLMRFIVKMPGHGIAWHYDDAGSYKTKFPNADTSKLKRLWFSVQDWKDGHAFQISKTVLSNWNKGSVYQIPFGIGHASSNFGYTPQYTVSFTGIISD
jgi:hypothetical protein|tara:strand:+ start:122 stop:772 length:651 start_codon:yes stop_codon:yes gene_type:complete